MTCRFRHLAARPCSRPRSASSQGLPAGDLVGFATSSGPGAVNPTRDRAPISAALAAVVGEYMDPRSIDRGSPAGKEAGPDQSLGISQSLDIDRGDHAAFEQAILNECYHGDTTLMPKAAVESIAVGNKCASDIQVQARRTAALTRQTTGRQVGAFQSVIGAMKGATGIKHLLLITQGVGITFDATSLQPVARAAADAGIQLSVVVEEPGLSLTDTGRRDEGGGAKGSTDTGMSQRRREDNAMFVTGAHTLADMVGGAFYRVIGSADPFFQRIAVASSAVYRLAVEPPADAAPGKDFSLVATVKRSGLTALTNKRAMVTAPDAATTSTTSLAPPKAAPAKGVVTVDDQLRAAMNAGRAFDGVPVTMTSAVRRAAEPGQLEIGIRVQIPSTAKGPLTAVFGVVDEAGKLRSGRKVIDAPPEGEGYGLTFAIPVAPGPYRLRFAVADASGRVGAVEKAVRAELAPMGPFAVGDLQTSWLDADEKEQADFPPADDLPPAAKTLSVSLELFQLAGAAVPRDIIVKVTFGTIERIVVPSSDSGIWRAEAQFSLDRVTAGSYPVEATVMVEGKAVGSRSAVVKKRVISGAKLER